MLPVPSASEPPARPSLHPVAKGAVIALILVWMLPGLVGRDPWKADEPYSLGMVSNILRTGDLVVPAVAGIPFLEKPPLYYLSAALSASVFGGLFALHDAARLVNIFWLTLTFLAVGLAAREIGGDRAGWTALVLLLGTVSLQLAAHKLITDVALLSGFALGIFGLALCRRRPVPGGIWAGTGMGVGFLSKGLLAPGILAVVAAVMPFLAPSWRGRAYARTLAVAAVAFLPWLLIWPAALADRSPAYFVEWFWYQNLGRFFGFARGGHHDNRMLYLLNLPWMAWPVLPLGLWTLWRTRAERSRHPVWHVPVATFLAMFAVLSVSASSRGLYALPMLLPLTIMAAVGTDALPGRAVRAIDRSLLLFFGLVAALIVAAWTFPAAAQTLPFFDSVLHTPTVHYPPVSVSLLVGASFIVVFVTVLVFTALRHLPPLSAWTVGMVLLWGLCMTLWLPWFEAGGSYRIVYTSIRDGFPSSYRCVASYGLGESERAMLEYYAGVRTLPLERPFDGPCDLLLVGRGREGIDDLGRDHWRVLWQGERPPRRPKEHYTLYQATPDNVSASAGTGRTGEEH